ncbi:hypothetical protein [Herbiconiux sp.]|uniref:hypothetical protein n=1 Tax=Herbiconiux sp. TaxID=1871186 RepID=UPI0025BAB27E|nr:hypothetical protein [Herbiconiux sp.]
MRALHYIDDVLIVDDEVCLAVFEYAVALARSGSADLITIPILWGGRRESANLVLGPSSQLFCTPTAADGADADLRDATLTAELRQRTAMLGPTSAVALPTDEGLSGTLLEDF